MALPAYILPIMGKRKGYSYETDGTNEYALRNVVSFQSGDSSGTICGWIKLDTVGVTSRAFFSSGDTAAATRYFVFYINTSGQVTVAQRNADVASTVHGGTVLSTGVWYHIGLVSNGTAWTIYLNGVAESLTVAAGVNNGDWFADTAQRDNIVLGAFVVSSVVDYHDGKIANPGIFTASFTAGEMIEAMNLKMQSLLTHSQAGTIVAAWEFTNGQADFPTYIDYGSGTYDLTMQNGEATDITTDVPT